jgi:hypothetical protein
MGPPSGWVDNFYPYTYSVYMVPKGSLEPKVRMNNV